MKTRRRTYLIDRGIQIRFTFFFVFIAAVGNILALIIFNKLALERIDAVLWKTHISISSTDDLIRPLFIHVNIASFLFVAALLILTGVIIMKKTKGPLLRISKDIVKVADGDLASAVTLRQKDEFEDVAVEINNMTENLRVRFSDIKIKCRALTESIAVLADGSAGREDAAKNCSMILEKIDEIEKSLNRFEV